MIKLTTKQIFQTLVDFSCAISLGHSTAFASKTLIKLKLGTFTNVTDQFSSALVLRNSIIFIVSNIKETNDIQLLFARRGLENAISHLK